VGTIVVGVDGSEGAGAALEFAAGEAVFRGARLRVVAAWEVPVTAYGTDLAPPPLDPTMWEAVRTRAQQIADDALAAAKRMQPSLDGEALEVQGSRRTCCSS
jgi:nucleotide-binding universal stress UspA family protein